MTEHENDHARQNAAAAVANIVEMVAALECDFARLAELRDERDGYDAEEENGPAEWASANPDDAEELAELETAAGDFDGHDDAQQRINDDPLSIEVRSGWTSLGETLQPEEFNILLTTGGPACRIIGELNDHGEPSRAWVEYQDWGTPWTEYVTTGTDHDALLTYCRQFYFGEGR